MCVEPEMTIYFKESASSWTLNFITSLKEISTTGKCFSAASSQTKFNITGDEYLSSSREEMIDFSTASAKFF